MPNILSEKQIIRLDLNQFFPFLKKEIKCQSSLPTKKRKTNEQLEHDFHCIRCTSKFNQNFFFANMMKNYRKKENEISSPMCFVVSEIYYVTVDSTL